ncbi:hypothetical protein HIM_10214 [Hirsutella minnesotensis 3608]|uniref:Uncharacterized protein n=1 Tax=Hirsutella minnesotensis 3608 TaxID=1043627 RepID=A0A0F7ZKC3_9HYPO|nr:hypothetical protein HIM_10214 [Hirsutella minnesotensis 3608]
MAYPHGSLSRHDEAAAIFSPTVARIAASTARDWAYVDSWLASKFPPSRSPPFFERNQDTLKILLSLAAANEVADEERRLLALVDASALQGLVHRDGDLSPNPDSGDRALRLQRIKADLLDLVHCALPKEGIDALNSLAKLAALRGAAFVDPEDLGRDILNLQGRKFELEHMSARLYALERHVLHETESAAGLSRRWRHDSFKPLPNLAKQNLDLQRKIKLMSSQLDDLRERLRTKPDAIRVTHPTIEDVSREEQELLTLLSRKKKLEAQIATFGDLPSDPIPAKRDLHR